MSTFGFLLLCVQACLIQTISAQCYGNGLYPGAVEVVEVANVGLAGNGMLGYGNGAGLIGGLGNGAGLIGGLGYGAGLGLGGAYGAGLGGAYGAGLGATGLVGAYGGLGNGEVAVAGELPVAGSTIIAGQVPVLGAVQFSGSVPAAGSVAISGNCGCGCNGGIYY